jgi:hypothetical protein
MHGQPQNRTGSRWKWALLGFLAVAAFFLFTEHRAHLFGFLPFLLVAACLLLHLFMHKGHGGPAGGDDPHAHAKESAKP